VAARGERGRVRTILAAAVRFTPALVVKPAGVALFSVVWLMPRRLPDLPRFTASAGFGPLHDPAVQWTDAQFGLIEAGAPWLDLAGRRLDDSCEVRADKGFDFRLATIGVEGQRSVTAIYGADGPLPALLAGLGAVLGRAGWGDFFSYGASASIPRGALESQSSPVTGNLQPGAPGVGPEVTAAGTEPVPPAGVHQARQVTIGWASRGQPPDPKWTLDGRWHAPWPAAPEPPTVASRRCRPVDCRYADTEALAADALSRHEHAIAIRLNVCYFLNPDVRRYPMRRRIFPSR
jgi:hypothetical protein